jgi:poly(3-hydroxyalkanoate) depolymerase
MKTKTSAIKYHSFNYHGLSIRYAVRQGKPDNLPVLIFNGVGQSIEVLIPVIEALKEREIIVIDVPGTGKSDTSLLPWRFRRHAKLAAAVLDRLNHPQVNVIGFSWGGVLAQQFAYSYPDRCKKLVLAASPPGNLMFPGNPMVYLRMANVRRFWNKVYMRSVAGLIYGGTVRHSLKEVDKTAQRLIPPTQRGYLYQAATMYGSINLAWLWRLKQPTLILQGSDDPMIPNINAHAMAALIPDSRLEFIDCGHMFILTKLKVVASKIESFLCV